MVDSPDTHEGWPSPSVKDMNFIAWIIMGLIAGAIAKSIMKEKGGWVSSLVIGLIGGVVGGWIGSAIFDRGVTGFFSSGRGCSPSAVPCSSLDLQPDPAQALIPPR